MSLLVARIEHTARRVSAWCLRAITERCSGFSNYEAGDYLTRQAAAPSRTYTLADVHALRWSQCASPTSRK